VSAGIGIAGRAGEDVRSDARVRVEIGGRGLDLVVRSKVEPYYGRAIRAQVGTVLDRLGVRDARVEIDDSGALPFALAARVEAAARRAGAAPAADARLERTAPDPGPTDRRRLRRSRLYLPGDEPKYMPAAGLYRPDGVILDLEDSVHADAKDEARLLVRNALRAIDFRGAERMVRINPLPVGLGDLEAVIPERPDLILVPKVETPDALREVDAAIGRLAGAGGVDGAIWLMPILETALGIENAFAIAGASERVVALTIGLEDYAADLGVPRSADGAESAWARARLVNAARAAGVAAIDSVYGQVDDLDGLARAAAAARRLGFEGMGCVHPRQIGPIHAAFTPSPAELARARAIVAAWEQARARGSGVVSLGSKMVDLPVVRQAERLVQEARRQGWPAEGETPEGA